MLHEGERVTAEADLDILSENLRCKIIYYSCITPNTISDLNKAWGYSSPTYLYQNNSLETLKDADLITVEKDGGSNVIHSNYNALFAEQNLEASRADINGEIVKEFLIHSKGFHPRAEHDADEQDLLHIGRGNLDEELEENLQALEFDRGEYQTLATLWENDIFISTFLSLENIARLFRDHKDELPDNPLNCLFRLTGGVTASISRGQHGKQHIDIPPGLRYRTENIIVPSHRTLQDHATSRTEEYGAFRDAMKSVYTLFRTKFQEERFNYDFMQEFVDLTIQDEENRKFNKLFKKYGSDKRSLF